MKKKYKYTGEIVVSIPGVGEVKPGDVIETDVEIDNPQFELITEDSKKSKKEEKEEE